jgi:hypothetical protein
MKKNLKRLTGNFGQRQILAGPLAATSNFPPGVPQ